MNEGNNPFSSARTNQWQFRVIVLSYVHTSGIGPEREAPDRADYFRLLWLTGRTQRRNFVGAPDPIRSLVYFKLAAVG
jgi:hypothetical protein